MRRLSLVAASGGYSSLWCVGFSLQWLLLLWSTGSKRVGFSSCGTRDQQLWLTGLVAPRHVGSSWTRARTRVPCIGRRILNHCATREAQKVGYLMSQGLSLSVNQKAPLEGCHSAGTAPGPRVKPRPLHCTVPTSNLS